MSIRGLLYFLIILIAFSGIICDLNDDNETSKFSNLNMTTLCSGKLFMNQISIQEVEIEKICQILLNNQMFILRIRKLSLSEVSDIVSLESTSNKFFDSVCNNFTSMCEMGILIDLYTEEKIIYAHLGLNPKKKITNIYKNRVMQTARHNFFKSDWATGLDEVVRLLNYKLNSGKTRFNQGQSNEPKKFIWDILIPYLCAIFFFLFTLILLMSKGFMNGDLFQFLDKIIQYWEEISDSSEKRIKLPVNTCLFCMKGGNKTYKFLYCNHSYHPGCLHFWQLDVEKCCPCSYIAVKGEESGNINNFKPAYLNCEDIRTILGYLLDAHCKSNVYDYFIENEEKIKLINEKYNISFEEMLWVYTNKLEIYRDYRVFHHIYKTVKMMFCLLTFYPAHLSKSKRKKRKASEKEG